MAGATRSSVTQELHVSDVSKSLQVHFSYMASNVHVVNEMIFSLKAAPAARSCGLPAHFSAL
eukprot:735196-Pleurochrysis_carterae.AAC.2